MKRCSQCLEYKDISCFPVVNLSNRTYIRAMCRNCIRHNENEFRSNNLEHSNKKSKKYRLKNPEKVKHWNKVYREKNKEKIKIRQKKAALIGAKNLSDQYILSLINRNIRKGSRLYKREVPSEMLEAYRNYILFIRMTKKAKVNG